MKPGIRKLINFLFIGVTIALVCILAFGNSDLENAWEALFTLDPWWLLGAAGCWFAYLFFDALGYHYFLRKQGYGVKLSFALYISLMGFYYSNITPGASGGQPMQIFYMKKDKLPIPVTTLVLMIVTITYKAVLVVIGVLICFLGGDFLRGYLGDYMWVFYLGVGLNVFCVTFMMILVFAPGLAKWIMVKGLKIIEHVRILKPKKARLEKLEASMDQYHATAAFWASHKRIILNVFIITFVQRCILFTVTYWVYRALGLHEYGILTVTILQAARGYGVKDKELSFVGCQRNVAFASNAFLPVFGVDGDAAVTCWESLVNLDVEFTVFHELFDFGDTCGVALLFLFTHCEKAGKKKYSYWNDCFQRFHVLVVFCKYKCCFNI